MHCFSIFWKERGRKIFIFFTNISMVSFLDSGVQCSAELDALYEVYMEQSADFDQRENTVGSEENKQASLSNLQKVKRHVLF